MADFNIRSDSVDVEQIMEQIRARIREKRGVDYTEEQVRELASVRLEKFLDPKNLRSDLLEQFRRSRPALPDLQEPPPAEPPYTFDDDTLFTSHRAPLRWLRRMFRPVLKLFFNTNRLAQVLSAQAKFNDDMLRSERRRRIEMHNFDRARAEWNMLYYEVLHNLVLETTRSGIEVKNLKMRVEALASRLDFSERRVRALEGVVQYRPEALRPRERSRPARTQDVGEGEAPEGSPVPTGEGAPPQGGPSLTPGEARRRRRRRRSRRGSGLGAPQTPGEPQAAPDADAVEGDEPMEAADADRGADEARAFVEQDAEPETAAGSDSEPAAPSHVDPDDREQ